MPILTPDVYFPHITDIPGSFFAEHGLKLVILDVDNTLTRHNHPDVDGKILCWLDRMKAGGVRMIVLSNNSTSRVKPFAGKLGLPFQAGAMKPMTWGYRRAAEQMSLPAEQTAVVGDQIFTDIAGGNLAGMKSILVEPFEMERHWGFRLKRKLERPILRKLRKKTGREGV